MYRGMTSRALAAILDVATKPRGIIAKTPTEVANLPLLAGEVHALFAFGQALARTSPNPSLLLVHFGAEPNKRGSQQSKSSRSATI